MTAPDEIVRSIDPSLTYRRTFQASTSLVYEVERDGSVYVLKIAIAGFEWGIEMLKREVRILTLADSVSGITHLIHDYRNSSDYEIAILKEYFVGRSLSSLEQLIRNSRVQAELERTVSDLHSLGIADLDISSSNVVISADHQEARLVDLGYGSGSIHFRFSDRMPWSRFYKMKSRDLRDLEALFLRYFVS